MPQLITERSKKKRPLPPSGRRIEYQRPSSPFQKMIEAARVELDLSFEDIGKAIGKHKGTVWIWIHNKNGYPAPRNCGPQHLEKLARVLKLDLAELKNALDASRHIVTPQQNPVPLDVIDAWNTLEATLVNMGDRRIRASQLLNLVRRLRPESSGSAAPAKK